MRSESDLRQKQDMITGHLPPSPRPVPAPSPHNDEQVHWTIRMGQKLEISSNIFTSIIIKKKNSTENQAFRHHNSKLSESDKEVMVLG